MTTFPSPPFSLALPAHVPLQLPRKGGTGMGSGNVSFDWTDGLDARRETAGDSFNNTVYPYIKAR